MAEDFTTQESNGVEMLTVDLKIYSLDSLLKTAYWFTNRCFLHLQHASPETVEVRFKCRPGNVLARLPEEFMNELLDQALRDRIGRETEGFKNLILAHALSKTCLIHPEREVQEPFVDPLGISKPDNAKSNQI